jgi:hypothetical protein
MRTSKINRTRVAVFLFLLLGAAAIGLAFHAHDDCKQHSDCSLCSALHNYSAIIPCLAIVIVYRGFLPSAFPLAAVMVSDPPAFNPASPRGPPFSR